MGRGATKAAGNVWFEARIAAAKYNDRLSSRAGAAELLNLSEDAVKSAELGLYKCMPVDNAVLMADMKRARRSCTADPTTRSERRGRNG